MLSPTRRALPTGETPSPRTAPRCVGIAALPPGLAALAALLALSAPGRASAAEPPEPSRCTEVQTALDALARTPLDQRRLRRIAPYVGPATAAELARAAREAPADRAFDLYVAAGYSRHAEALRTIHLSPAPGAALAKAGRALALLALGDAVASGTVSAALWDAPLEVRRRTCRALGRMKHLRPRDLLWEAMDDEDEYVRLWAALAWIDSGAAKPKRVLNGLLASTAKGVRTRAARSLVENGASIRPELLSALPPHQRAQAVVLSRPPPARMRADLKSTEPWVRAAAFAGLVLSGEAPKRLEKEAPKSATVDGALVMALALLGEKEALTQLSALDPAGAQAAVQVLWAHGPAAQRESSTSAELASKLALVLERWLVTGAIPDDQAPILLRSLEDMDGEAGARVARARLLGPDGKGLRTAARVLARAGAPSDVPALLGTSRRVADERSRAEVLKAAAILCSR